MLEGYPSTLLSEYQALQSTFNVGMGICDTQLDRYYTPAAKEQAARMRQVGLMITMACSNSDQAKNVLANLPKDVPHVMLDALFRAFQSQGMSMATALTQQITSMKQARNEGILMYYGKYNATQFKLKCQGVNMDPLMAEATFLNGINREKYKGHSFDFFDYIQPSESRLATIVQKIRQWEMDEEARSMRSSSSSSRGAGPEATALVAQVNKGKCNFCGVSGHLSNICRKLKRLQDEGKTPSRDEWWDRKQKQSKDARGASKPGFKFGKGKGKQQQNPHRGKICSNCGGKNHIAANCRSASKNSSGASNQANAAFVGDDDFGGSSS